MNNNKKVIMNKVMSLIMETVWAMLIIVGVLVLVAEDQTACAVLAGLGLLANIIMIINEYYGIKIWLDIMENDATTVIIKEDNK